MTSGSKSLHDVLDHSFPDLSEVAKLLDEGCDVNALDEDGRTPLHIATYMNETTDAMRLLLRDGADPNDGGAALQPPLFRAVDDTHNMATKISFLLDYGADPNITHGSLSILGYICKLPASLSHVKAKLIVLLLEEGAHAFVEDAGPGFFQPIQAVAAVTDEEGWPANCLDLIVQAIPEPYRQQQLDLALRTSATATYGHKLSDQSRYKPCSLEFAFGEGPFAALYLISQGADPDTKVSEFYTVLHYICSRRSLGHEHRELFTRLLSSRQGTPHWIDEKDGYGRTALYWAVQKGNRDFVLALLRFGAAVNIVSESRQSPLHALCVPDGDRLPHKVTLSAPESLFPASERQEEGASGHRDAGAAGFHRESILRLVKPSLVDEEIVQALLANGADILLRNEAGQTPFTLACETGNAFIAANIIYHLGPDITLHGPTKDLGKLLFDKNKSGQTPLHLAARGGHLDVVKLLLDPRHVFVREVNPWRLRATTSAPKNLMPKTVEAKMIKQLEKELFLMQTPGMMPQLTGSLSRRTEDNVSFTIGTEQRSWLDYIQLPNVSFSTWNLDRVEAGLAEQYRQADEEGRTPLHHAAAGGHVEVVRCLLDTGIMSADARDRNGKTPADLALDNGHDELWHVLVHQVNQSGAALSVVTTAVNLLRGLGLR